MLGHRATSEDLIYQKVSAMKPNRLFISLVTISNKYYDDEAEDVFLFSPWFERRIIQHCKKYGESWWWQS